MVRREEGRKVAREGGRDAGRPARLVSVRGRKEVGGLLAGNHIDNCDANHMHDRIQAGPGSSGRWGHNSTTKRPGGLIMNQKLQKHVKQDSPMAGQSS